MQRVDSVEKTLMLGKSEGRTRRGWQRMRCLDGITASMDMGLGKLQELVMIGRPDVLRSMGSQRVGHDWATDLNWTELMWDLPRWGIDCVSWNGRQILYLWATREALGGRFWKRITNSFQFAKTFSTIQVMCPKEFPSLRKTGTVDHATLKTPFKK